jgi:hypothetical protein
MGMSGLGLHRLRSILARKLFLLYSALNCVWHNGSNDHWVSNIAFEKACFDTKTQVPI